MFCSPILEDELVGHTRQLRLGISPCATPSVLLFIMGPKSLMDHLSPSDDSWTIRQFEAKTHDSLTTSLFSPVVHHVPNDTEYHRRYSLSGNVEAESVHIILGIRHCSSMLSEPFDAGTGAS